MGGIRSGKSYHGALQLVCRHKLGRLYWIVAEEYDTCTPEFEYTVQFLQHLGMVDAKHLSTPARGPKSVLTTDGVLIETRSAEDYRRIAEKAPDGIVGCEVGRWRWQTFQRVSERLSQQRGWAWLSGTFEGSLGWQAEKYNQWQGDNLDAARSFSIPTSTNLTKFSGPDDPELLRLKASFPEDYFNERFMGIPVPPTGRVYREFQYTTHVSTEAKYVVGSPVEVWIDPGYRRAYAVLATQVVGDVVHIVDEVYVQSASNADVIRLCKQRPWWKDVAGRGVVDIAGRGHAAERSPVEAWWADANIHLDSDFVHIQDGIDRVKSFLQGRLLVHPQCVGLIAEMGVGKHPFEGMGVYRYRTDAAGSVMDEKPIDENNHACSALAYGLVRRFGRVNHELGVAMSYRGAQPSRAVSYLNTETSPSWKDFTDAVARVDATNKRLEEAQRAK